MNTVICDEDWLEQGRSMKKKNVECGNLIYGFVWIFFVIMVIVLLYKKGKPIFLNYLKIPRSKSPWTVAEMH